MNPSTILESIIKLRSELETTKNIDPKVLEQIKAFQDDVQNKVSSNEYKAEESLYQQLLELETDFAVNHPVLERLTREIINRLSLMGI